MLEINKTYKMNIIDIGHSGEGIGKVDGFTVFAQGGIPEDEVKVIITESKKNFAKGEVTEILTPSPFRINPECNIYDKCGGCNFQEISYEKQLLIKQKMVSDAIERIGGFKDLDMMPVIGMEVPKNYRNKTQFSVGKRKIGFNQPKSHDIVPVSECMISHPTAIAVSKAVQDYLNAGAGIPDTPLNNDTNLGRNVKGAPTFSKFTILRNVIVKTAFNTGEVMVILVTSEGKLQVKDELCGKIRQNIENLNLRDDAHIVPTTHPQWTLKSVITNVNRKNGPQVFGPKFVTIFGKDHIKDSICGMKVKISPESFYQTNPFQAEKLIEIVKKFADIKGDEIIYDLYSGVGTIGLSLATNAKKVIGIESIETAVSDAKENATINGITNAEFICAKAENEISQIKEKEGIPDIIILDPPRGGCERRLLEAILDMDLAKKVPKKIIYVSCNPATLARDLKILCQDDENAARSSDGTANAQYKIEKIQPIDMFPWTGHVEAVVVLEK